ncbi:MAG: catechol 2,3-dioxygenase [Propionibacterium sp.]|nr:catechol 2,3-dioxygenase [Propionibacterium sp.]
MAIMRMGYAHVRVTNMAEARQHYTETLGLIETLDQDGKVYFKGWDEHDHHSVVIEEGGVGVVKFGFKAENEDDIARVERACQTFGVTTERMSKGDNPEIGDGLRVFTPSDHVFEVYTEAGFVGSDVGYTNPEAFPRHTRGIGAPALDHALITAEDAALMERFLKDAFGYFTTEQVCTSLDDDAEKIAVWMTNNNQIHQLAVLAGPQGKLHHFAFRLDNWNDVGRSADLMAMDDVPIDVGPTRHGITRGQTVYFFDPSGNRNEVFAGGYLAFPDRPTVTWTADQIGKGIFYHARELNERFTSVLT